MRATTRPRPGRTSHRWFASSPREHDVDLSTLDRHRGGRTDPQVRRAGGGRTHPGGGRGPGSPHRPSPRPPQESAAPEPPGPQRWRSRPGGHRAASADKVEKMSRMRQVIATRMVESLQTSAQLTTVVEVDVTQASPGSAQLAKADFEAREGVKLSFLPFFAVAAVEALKAHPVVNRLGRHGRRSTINVSRCRAPGHRGRHRSRAARAGHPRCR